MMMKRGIGIILMLIIVIRGFSIYNFILKERDIKRLLYYMRDNKESVTLYNLNLFREYYQLTYFYTVKDNHYGVSAYDLNREWLNGSGFEYDANGEEVDDNIDYDYISSVICDEVFHIIQDTTYGYMNSYYIKVDDYLLGIDIIRKDNPIQRTIRDIVTITVFLSLLSILLILIYNKGGD
jgi:hypothetical protein